MSRSLQSRMWPGTKRKRSDRKSKPSARYTRILEDEGYEAQIQKAYSPATVTNVSERCLPLHLCKQRDGPKFRMPTLQSMCLAVMAKNFLTHVLPSQATFQAAAHVDSKGKSKARADARIISRGIGGRPILDEETAAGDNYVPSDDEDSPERFREVGIAAAPSRKRRSRMGQDTSTSVPPPQLSTDDLAELSHESHQLLKLLQQNSALKLLRLLRVHAPNALSRHVLTTYFVNGRSEIELDASMILLAERPDQINLIMRSIGPASGQLSSFSATPSLRRLNLSGLTRLSPQSLSALFRRSAQLEEVILRGCVRVDASCMEALMSGGSAETLRVLNVNFTEIGPQGLETIVSKARNLRVLKIADVHGLSDKVIPEMVRRSVLAATESRPPRAPLSRLKSLKVRGTSLGIVGLSSLVQLCKPTLESLDAGLLNFSSAEQAMLLGTMLGYGLMTEPCHGEQGGSIRAPLRKLNLSGNFVGKRCERAGQALVDWLVDLSESLQKLLLDSVYLSQNARRQLESALLRSEASHQTGSGAGMDEAPRPWLRYSLARSPNCFVPEDFEGPPGIKNVAQNLDLSGNPLSEIALLRERIGGSMTLRPLLARHLNLSDSRSCDDELVKMFAQSSPRLQSINLSGTAVSSEGVIALIKGCPFLTTIDLTGCRGVHVRDRRNAFALLDGPYGEED